MENIHHIQEMECKTNTGCFTLVHDWIYCTTTTLQLRNLIIRFFLLSVLIEIPSLLQAVEAAQLAEDLKVQLEHTQAKLKEIQVSVAENRTARERESSNLKRAQVCCIWISLPTLALLQRVLVEDHTSDLC